jgi:prepilin-type N-terminal cleavage/methylation domain-containing protein
LPFQCLVLPTHWLNIYKMKRKNKGFTLVEILIAIALMALISTVVIFSFSKVNSMGALDKGSAEIVSTLNEARSLTLSSKDSSSYGVRFGESEVVLFRGVYNPSSSENILIPLNSLIRISGVSLVGGGSEVLFERLSGRVETSGSVTVSLVNDPSQSKIINIHETGLSEIN